MPSSSATTSPCSPRTRPPPPPPRRFWSSPAAQPPAADRPGQYSRTRTSPARTRTPHRRQRPPTAPPTDPPNEPWQGSAAAPAGSPDPFWILHSSCKYYLIFAACCTATTHRKALPYKGSPGPTRFLCPEFWNRRRSAPRIVTRSPGSRRTALRCNVFVQHDTSMVSTVAPPPPVRPREAGRGTSRRSCTTVSPLGSSRSSGEPLIRPLTMTWLTPNTLVPTPASP